ncbi:hypothetical protein [Plantactinospora sonchi]|uniref:WXG100 family type VII secretion target n=1 Tax=Plantactinospora sonchi TaxID=1544735 RepID=A0ABU7RY66_9ACTN
MTTQGGVPSAGTVAMRFEAVNAAGGSMFTYSKAIDEALQALHTALQPVRETWYLSGSASGLEAQMAEEALRGTLAEMSEIIASLGGVLQNAAAQAAVLDRALGQRIPGVAAGGTGR